MSTQRKLRKSISDSRPPIIFVPADYTLDKAGIEAMAQLFGRGAIMVTDRPLYGKVLEGVTAALKQNRPGVHQCD